MNNAVIGTPARDHIKNLTLQVVMFTRGSDCGAKKQALFIQEERATFKVIHGRPMTGSVPDRPWCCKSGSNSSEGMLLSSRAFIMITIYLCVGDNL
jgi:hypothetical protein